MFEMRGIHIVAWFSVCVCIRIELTEKALKLSSSLIYVVYPNRL